MQEDGVVLQGMGLTKQFKAGDLVVDALRGVDITITRGEAIAIIGPSGSGKSTLMGILGGLDTPTAGSLQIGGVDVTDMGENRLAEIRNEYIGFVFQQFNLLPTLTAIENVALPVQFSAKRKFNPRRRAVELLTRFGLENRLKSRPSQLSGGEQQRVESRGRSLTTRRCSCATSPRERWIPRTATLCWRRCSRPKRSYEPQWSSSPTTRTWPRALTAPSQ